MFDIFILLFLIAGSETNAFKFSTTACVNNRFGHFNVPLVQFHSRSALGPFNQLVTIGGASRNAILSTVRGFAQERAVGETHISRNAQRELLQLYNRLNKETCSGKWYYVDDGCLKRAPETWCHIIDDDTDSPFKLDVLPLGHPAANHQSSYVSFGVFATKDLRARTVVGDYTPPGHSLVYLEKEAAMNYESGAQSQIDSTVRVNDTNIVVNSNKLTVLLTRLNHSSTEHNCKFFPCYGWKMTISRSGAAPSTCGCL